MTNNMKKGIGMHIRSDPEIDAKPLPSQLPFRLLLMSELAPDGSGGMDQQGSEGILTVDKDEFAKMMKRISPRLFLEVPNLLGGGAGELELDITFPTIRSFHPEEIVGTVPALSALLEIRELLDAVRTGEIGPEDFGQRLQQVGIDAAWAESLHRALASSGPTEPADTHVEPPEAERLGSLLDMVDTDATVERGPTPASAEPHRVPNLFKALLDAIDGKAPFTSAHRSAVENLTAQIDELLARQINAILHHPRFQRLEAAWRGLKFLVDRIDFRKNVRLDVLPVRKKDIGEAFRREVLEVHRGGRTDPPFSAVLADFEFEATQDDLRRLENLAEMCAEAGTPVIVSAGSSFFGVEEPAQMAEVMDWTNHFQKPEYVPWRALRDQAVSNYLALVVPRFLLRYPYGRDNRVKRFDFTEDVAAPAKSLLWGCGALVVGVAAAHGFRDHGWPVGFSGLSTGARVADLPVWKAGHVHIPLEVLIPFDGQRLLAEAGFTVLSCAPDSDSAVVGFASTAHRPESYEDPVSNAESKLHATLSCRLFAARLVHDLEALRSALPAGLGAEGLRSALKERIEGLFRATGTPLSPDALNIDLSEDPDRPERTLMTIRLRSPEALLGSEVGLVLQFEIEGWL